jgi:hypothetical protein
MVDTSVDQQPRLIASTSGNTAEKPASYTKICTSVLFRKLGKNPGSLRHFYRSRVEKTIFLNRLIGAELRSTFEARIAPWSEV